MGEGVDDTDQKAAEARRRYAKFVARYRTDSRFRAAADADPVAALAKAGIPVQAGSRVRLVSVDPDERILLVPTRELSGPEASGAFGCFFTFGCLGTAGCASGCIGTMACIGTAGCIDISCIRTPDDGPAEPEDPDEPEEPEEPGDGGDTGLR